jgi:hypothetical protein
VDAPQQLGTFYAGVALLLTDGTVMVQDIATTNWWKLTPDAAGSYVNGTWSQLASLPGGYQPLYFASAVLPEGRVIVQGGEYQAFEPAWQTAGAIYDPTKDQWTSVAPPAGWTTIGDAQSVVLADGQFYLANCCTTDAALLDPTTLTWTAFGSDGQGRHQRRRGLDTAPQRRGPDRGHERLHRSARLGALQSADRVVVQRREHGRAARRQQRAGNRLVGDGTAGPAAGWDGARGTSFTPVATPPDGVNDSSYNTSFLPLPNGQILFTDFTNDIEIYTPEGQPQSEWAPQIDQGCGLETLVPGKTYRISGMQPNGLSQAMGYGDDEQAATNYPLVRISNRATGHVSYARTHDHSSMGVTPGAWSYTFFDVPATEELGNGELVVVANGIASSPIPVRVADSVGR